MDDIGYLKLPLVHRELREQSETKGFSMPSDLLIGTLLRTLIASKPSGHFLELGTGMSLTLSWMIDGMDLDSHIISVDNDPELIQVAESYFGDNPRVELVCGDGTTWLKEYDGKRFDLIFADTWPGKYQMLEETIALLKPGGFYIIDDMTPQPNWPEGHAEKADALLAYLDACPYLDLTRLNWSTGIVLAVRNQQEFNAPGIKGREMVI